MNYILVGLGGAIGSVFRYFIHQCVSSRNFSFPFATLLSNALSCLILGMALALFSKNILDEKQKFFIISGLCGGFSTFSTFTFETFQLFESGNYFLTAGNIVFNMLICFIFLFLGLKLF
ncbi:MAG: fluoride efflux transporter CrcB [Saprospiraceae bacterium]